MAGDLKRVHIYGTSSILHAMDVAAFLKQAGVDVKLVTKHSVQVRPDQVDKARAAAAGFSRWIEEKRGKQGR